MVQWLCMCVCLFVYARPGTWLSLLAQLQCLCSEVGKSGNEATNIHHPSLVFPCYRYVFDGKPPEMKSGEVRYCSKSRMEIDRFSCS